ncbi:MAG: hypothetical protein AAGC88_03950, partial [Bacteroidota bacterium]
MKITATFLSLILSLAIVSCGDGGKAEREALRDEVIAIHDEVMPKMGDLRKVRKSLEAMADTLATDSLNLASKLFRTLRRSPIFGITSSWIAITSSLSASRSAFP